ncbi:unnamed protein product [Colias eurytheme]|nr:unnamed protein product [Colias eurytheme]
MRVRFISTRSQGRKQSRPPLADKMRRVRYYEPPILASTCKFLCENTADKLHAWDGENTATAQPEAP